MKLTCQQCGKPTVVPKASSKGPAPVAAEPAPEKLDDLLQGLTENESARTEIIGYINQLSIQLHRWQLRLPTLNERKKDLGAEMDGIQKSRSVAGVKAIVTFSAN